MRQHRFYKAVWCWKEGEKKLSTVGLVEKDKAKQLVSQPGPPTKLESVNNQKSMFFFTDSIDQSQQMIFRQKCQRGVQPHVPNVVTLQDVKDVVIFSANGSIPAGFMKLFCSDNINLLLRITILYIQLYLKIWEDLEYRRASYKQLCLKHPISKERETLCKTSLRKLRSKIGQEYAMILSGEGIYKEHHHMNNTLNRSYTDQDMIFYDCLSKFITRTVWVALNRCNYKEIEVEISRLFCLKYDNRENISDDKNGHKYDRNILEGDKIQYSSKWYNRSPIISDVFTNQEMPDSLSQNEMPTIEATKTKLTGLEAALTLPEEVLGRLNITVGILGQHRDNFEPLLTLKQRQESIEDEELEKALAATAEEVKPKVKMYMYLEDLYSTIDLKDLKPIEETGNIIDEINVYINSHYEDSKRSYRLWERRKVSNWSLSSKIFN